ncbi:MAG: MGMT family protein [Candidatus Omnitrophota bacterium]
MFFKRAGPGSETKARGKGRFIAADAFLRDKRLAMKDKVKDRMKNKMKNKKRARLTPFQKKVLKVVAGIPLGETRSYQWVAGKIGQPLAARAVGQALRRNPYPLIIPCHRVVRRDGSLGAYAGRYDNKKAALLALEREIKNDFAMGDKREK